MSRLFFPSCPRCSPKEYMGLVGVPLKRRYFLLPDEFYCPKCKSGYSKEILGSDSCPRCKVKLIQRKGSYLYCPECGYPKAKEQIPSSPAEREIRRLLR